MLLLTETTDKLQLVTSAAADVDVHASFMDASDASPPVVDGASSGRQNTAITTAATTDIVAAPAASRTRNVKTLHVRNKDSADSTDVTVLFDQNGTDFELHKVTLAPGAALEYVEGIGWFTLGNQARLNELLVTTADVVNATTSWADITGLTAPVKAGKTYMFEAALLYICNATTTGARFGINGPAAPTYLRLGGIGTVTGSVTAAAFSTPVAAVSAYDTSAIGAQTTGPATEVTALIEGVIVPSADGTFAMRSQSEVAVASALTIRRGSRLHIREADNA